MEIGKVKQAEIDVSLEQAREHIREADKAGDKSAGSFWRGYIFGKRFESSHQDRV